MTTGGLHRDSRLHKSCHAHFESYSRYDLPLNHFASFLFASSWSNASSTLKPTTRSVTPGPTSAKTRSSAFPLPNRLVKALSSPSIKDQAEQQRKVEENGMTATTTNGHAESSGGEDMNAAVARPVQRTSVMMDTRTPSPPVRRPEDGSGDGTPEIQITPTGKSEGLNAEIQMLSTKLVNAINYNTNLDDTLQATRSELEQARQELARVRAEKRSLDDAITAGVLVKKSEVDATMSSLRAEMAQARAERERAETSKKQTEGELENLTSALFEEANTMVASARKDTEAVERRNGQLRSQLQDTEVLLASQQEQLQGLKETMEKLERADALRDASVPSTPVTGAGTGGFDAMIPQSSHSGAEAFEAIQPSHPLHFSSLLTPVLRNDIAAYADFSELILSARKAQQQPHSRNVSGNYSSTTLSTPNPAGPATSSPNLPGAFSFNGSTSANSSPSQSGFNAQYPYVNPPLKESKFWKRILLEDIEPTLRLDLAPGLSFLSRRTVNSSLLAGTLVVEPFPPPSTTYKFYAPVFACALCGESRKVEPYVRRFRFRTSEAEDAQRYPLCGYCLGRVRTSCDFVGFLRMVREGHWRCESEGDEKGAWEEAVKLRERMFWARLGGGVVPRGHVPVGSAASAVGQRESGDGAPAKGASDAAAEERQNPETIGSEQLDGAGPAPPLAESVEPDPEAESKGIGRALVNMSSRAASSAMPELKPQTPEPSPSSSLPEPGPTTTATTAATKQDQNEASAQLRREADIAAPIALQPPPMERRDTDPITPDTDAEVGGGLERFITPTEEYPPSIPSAQFASPSPSTPLASPSRPRERRTPSLVKSQSRPEERERAASPLKGSLDPGFQREGKDGEGQERKRLSSPIVSGPTSPVKTSLDLQLQQGEEGKRLSTPARLAQAEGRREGSPFKRPTSPAKPAAAVEEARKSERSRSRPGRPELRPGSAGAGADGGLGVAERRPSSQGSSVLARVRAMEAGGKK